MKIVCLIIIIIGVVIDFLDFLTSIIACIRLKKVPSAVPLIGFVLPLIGILGLKYFGDYSWSRTLLFIGVAFVSHLSFQMIFPIIFSIIINAIYRRKLLDFSPLPGSEYEKDEIKKYPL